MNDSLDFSHILKKKNVYKNDYGYAFELLYTPRKITKTHYSILPIITIGHPKTVKNYKKALGDIDGYSPAELREFRFILAYDLDIIDFTGSEEFPQMNTGPTGGLFEGEDLAAAIKKVQDKFRFLSETVFDNIKSDRELHELYIANKFGGSTPFEQITELVLASTYMSSKELYEYIKNNNINDEEVLNYFNIKL